MDIKQKAIFLYLHLCINVSNNVEILKVIINFEGNDDYTKTFLQFLKKFIKRKKLILKKYKQEVYLLKSPNVYLEYNLKDNTGGVFKKKFWDKKYKYKNIMQFADLENNDLSFYKFYLLKNSKLLDKITEWNGFYYRNFKSVRSAVYRRIFVWPYVITIKPKIIIIKNIYFNHYFTINKHKNYEYSGFITEWHSKIGKWKRNIGISLGNFMYNKYLFSNNNSYYRVFNLNTDLAFLNFFKIKKNKVRTLYIPNLKEYKLLKRTYWKRYKLFNKFYKRLLKKAFIGYTFFIRFYCIYFFWYLFYYNKFYFYYNKILFNLWIRFFSLVSLFENLSNNLFFSYNLLYKNLNYFYKYQYFFEFENILNFYIQNVSSFYYNINNNKIIIQDFYNNYKKYIYVIFYNYYKWYYNNNIYYNYNIYFKSILNKITKNEIMFFDSLYKTNYKCKLLYNIEYFSVYKYIARKKILRKKNILQIIKKNTNVLLK